MIKIKVCGMRDRENLRNVIPAEPDFLGFIFYPGSKRFVGKDPDALLFDMVPPSINKVGVFVNEPLDNIVRHANLWRLDFVQVHGTESAKTCMALKAEGLHVIKSFGIHPDFDFNMIKPFLQACDYFLFDTSSDQYGGSGKHFDWNILSRYQYNIPFFLSGGIDRNHSERISQLNHPALFGVDINSRFETEPGVKDVNMIREFINKIRNI